MPSITITLTDTQLKGLEYAALDPQDWAENAVTERARIANDEIVQDRKSTRLNSSHLVISYAVFCLKKKNKKSTQRKR